MLKHFIRPAKAFGLHCLPNGARLLAQKDRMQTYVVSYGDRYNSKEVLLQRIDLLAPKDRQYAMARSEMREHDLAQKVIPLNHHIDGKYPLNLMMTKRIEPFRPEGMKGYWLDSLNGVLWRCFSLNEGTNVKFLSGVPDIAYQATLMLGQYHKALSGLPDAYLWESRADFVATREFLDKLHRLVSQDPFGRSAGCLPEIRYALNHAHYAPNLLSLQEEGSKQDRQHRIRHAIERVLPLHAGSGICMADLKMAICERYPHRQLGSLRKAVHDSSQNVPQPDPGDGMIFSSRLVEGFLRAIEGMLHSNEFRQLILSGKNLAYELGIRFLKDHLLGDRRFPVDFPDQNLQRARKQFRLASRIEAYAEELRLLHSEIQLS